MGLLLLFADLGRDPALLGSPLLAAVVGARWAAALSALTIFRPEPFLGDPSSLLSTTGASCSLRALRAAAIAGARDCRHFWAVELTARELTLDDDCVSARGPLVRCTS